MAAAVAAALVMGVVGSCVDGDSPVAPDGTGAFSVALIPTFPTATPVNAAGDIVRIRVRMLLAANDSVLHQKEVQVDPNAAEWTVDLQVTPPTSGGAVYFAIELLDAAGAVAWSGATEPMQISGGSATPPQAVEVGRGPLTNLSVTGLAIDGGGLVLLPGDTTTLTASVTTTEPADTPRVYWTSLAESILTVSTEGRVTALDTGRTLVVAAAGPVADTVPVAVVLRLGTLIVTPDSVVLDSLPAEVVFSAKVFAVDGQELPGAEVVWQSRDPWMLEPVLDSGAAPGSFRAVAPGEGVIRAYAAADPDVYDDAWVITAFDFADVAVYKDVDRWDSFEGDTVTYTVVVENYGPDTAGDVSIRDSLPPGMTFVSASVTDGSYDGAAGVWSLEALAPDAIDTLTLLARVDSGQSEAELVNTAWLHHSSVFDEASDNDTSSVEIYVLEALADLALYKDVEEYEVFEGDTVTFTVLLDNYGPDAATGIRVRDSLPAGLSFTRATVSRGSFDADSLVWRLDSLEAGGTDTLLLTARVDSGLVASELVNTVYHLGLAEQVDDEPENDTSQVEIYVDARFADIDVYKDVTSYEDFFEGDTVTFVIEVSNWGPEDATGVRVVDSLGAGLRLVDTRLTRGTFSSGGVWQIDSLPADVTDTLWLLARVDSGTVDAELTNHAWSLGLTQQVDDDADNDTSVVGVFVSAKEADIAVEKDLLSFDDVFEGDTVSFVIEVANWGGFTAHDVRVRDSLPPGLTLVDAAVTRGFFDTATGIWALDSLSDTVTDTLLLRARVDSGTVFTELENVAWSLGLSTELDLDVHNDTSRVSLYVDRMEADLAVYKDVDLYEAHEGDTVRFEVVVENYGPFVAHGAVVQDTLPSGLTFLQGQVTLGSLETSTLVWSLGDLPEGSSDTLWIQATVDPGTEGTTLTNVAFSHGLTTETDPYAENDTTSVPVSIVSRFADVAVWKDVDETDPLPGDTVTFTVTVDNWGPFDAHGLVVADAFPGALTILDATVTTGSYNQATGAWSLGTLAADGSDTLFIKAEVPLVAATSEYTNVAWSLGPTPEVDPDALNDTSRVVVRVDPQLAGLGVRKYVDEPKPFERDTVTFFISLDNYGAGDAGSIVVRDSLPAGLTFIDAVASAGSYDPATGSWAVDTLFDGFAESLELRAQVDTGTALSSLENVAWIQSYVGPADLDAQNDTARAEVRVGPRQADVDVHKTVDVAEPFEGDTVTFTVAVTNWGPFEASSVVVRDTMATGLRRVSSTVTRGSLDSWTGIWTVGDLPVGAADTLTLVAQVDSGFALKELVNVAWSLGLLAEVDTDATNDTSFASVFVGRKEADVSLFKDVDLYDPYEGDTVAFTVEVANWGPDPAHGVSVVDSLPTGLSFVSAAVSRGSYDPATGVWSMGDLPEGSLDTLTLRARVDSGTVFQTLVNRAWTPGLTTEFDPDLSSDTAYVDLTVAQREAEVVVDKVVDELEPFEGDSVTFTVEVANYGPEDAHLLEVRDSLEAGLTFVSASVTRGSFSEATGIWTVGTLPADSVDTLTLVARVDSGTVHQELDNVAWHTGLVTEVDPDPSTDTSSITVWVDQREADVALYKEADEWAPFESDTVTFAIELANYGPHDATGVVVRDSLPAGLTFLSAEVSGGIVDDSAHTWTVDTLPAYEADTLLLKVVVDSGFVSQDLTNLAWHQGPQGQVDPDLSNDSSAATVTVEQREADVALEKDVDDYEPFEGDTLTFVVYLDNYGPEDATGVTVVDSLGPGLTFVSASPSIGAFDAATLTWSVPLLPWDATDSLLLRAVVDSGTVDLELENWVWHNGLSQQVETDPSNDTSWVSVTVFEQQADIALDKWVDDEFPVEGDTVTFTVTADNYGPDDATSVSLVDSLGPGLTFMSASVTGGSFDEATLRWTFDTLAAGDSETLTLVASVDAGTLGERLKNVIWSEGLTHQQEQNFLTDTAAAFVSPAEVDLEVLKSVDVGTPAEGDTVTFTLTLINHGPQPATSVTVMDTLPPGLTFVSESGGYAPATGLWTVGGLATGDTVTLELRAAVDTGTGGSTLWNEAWVEQVDQVDVDEANDFADVSLTVPAAQQAPTPALLDRPSDAPPGTPSPPSPRETPPPTRP